MGKLKFTQGVTLIEVMVAMIIVMIIASFLLATGGSARRKAMETKAAAMIASLEVAISMYHTDFAAYPPDGGPGDYQDNAQLVDLLSNIAHDPVTGTDPIPGWRGPYIEFKREDYLGGDPTNGIIVDPWEQPYHYAVMVPAPAVTWGNVSSYNLWSAGFNQNDESSDGDADFGDDIHNW